jgi:hypothetical protein
VFEDEHVLTGDPTNPPAELEHGQLLWDGVEGGGGSGGPGEATTTPWEPYTPTVLGLTIGNGVQNNQWRYSGTDTIEVSNEFTLGTTSAVTDRVLWGPPPGLTIDGSVVIAGNAYFVDAAYDKRLVDADYDERTDRAAGTDRTYLATVINNGNNIGPAWPDNQTGKTSYVAATEPFTWEAGDRMSQSWRAKITRGA